MRSKSHDAAMAELYQRDPALALDVIISILDEQLTVMRQLTPAVCGPQTIVEQTPTGDDASPKCQKL